MDNETRNMFELILNKLDAMDRRLDAVDRRLDTMEIRQGEIYSVVKAIEHSNQVHKAEIDNINVRTAYVEGTINAIGDVIDKRRAV